MQPRLSFTAAKRSAPIAVPEAPANVEIVQLRLLDGDDLAWTVSMAQAVGVPASLQVPAPPSNAKVALSLVGQFVYLTDAVELDGLVYPKTSASSAPFPVEK